MVLLVHAQIHYQLVRAVLFGVVMDTRHQTCRSVVTQMDRELLPLPILHRAHVILIGVFNPYSENLMTGF